MINLEHDRLSFTFPVESRSEFRQLDREAQDRHRLRVLTLTADEIEAALRTAALRAIQAPVRRSLLAGVLPPGYPFPMPAAVRREFTLQALDGALATAARQVRESLTKKGLPRYVLEDGVLIRIAPDGTRKPMRRTSAVAKRGPKPGRRGH